MHTRPLSPAIQWRPSSPAGWQTKPDLRDELDDTGNRRTPKHLGRTDDGRPNNPRDLMSWSLGPRKVMRHLKTSGRRP